MKKETNIAKENVELFIRNGKDIIMRGMCQIHLKSCQRFLEFLKNSFDWSLEQDICKDAKHQGIRLSKGGEHFNCIIKSMATKRSRINNKIKDLKNAIKVYEDNGIK